MASESQVDMSLDEIIRLNRKRKAVKPISRGKARVLAAKTFRQGLRPQLSRPMKSRQNSAALAIFQRARKTAAVAAKVASDAAAMLAPRTINSRKLAFGRANDLRVTRINRTRNLPITSRGRNNVMSVKTGRRMLPVVRQQQQQRQHVINRTNATILQRNNLANQRLNNQAFNRPRNQFTSPINQQTNFRNQPRRIQQRGRINNRRLNANVTPQLQQFNHQGGMLQAQRNQQYLAQARALIRARQEINMSQSRGRGRFNGRR